MSKPRSYEAAIRELETIVRALEEGEMPIDQLSVQVKRAAELIAYCKEKLLFTEQEVQTVLADLRGKAAE